MKTLEERTQKAEELKRKYQEICNARRENLDRFEGGEIGLDEFCETDGKLNHKVSGWRNSFMFWLASVCDMPVAEIRRNHARFDEIDLYAKYLKY